MSNGKMHKNGRVLENITSLHLNACAFLLTGFANCCTKFETWHTPLPAVAILSESPTLCKTNEAVSRACKFPFIFEGKNYTNCIELDSDGAWCSVQVDTNGVHVTGIWGYCDLSCLKVVN